MRLIHCGDCNIDNSISFNKSFEEFKPNLKVGQTICTKDRNTGYVRIWVVDCYTFKNNYLDSFGRSEDILWYI